MREFRRRLALVLVRVSELGMRLALRVAGVQRVMVPPPVAAGRPHKCLVCNDAVLMPIGCETERVWSWGCVPPPKDGFVMWVCPRCSDDGDVSFASTKTGERLATWPVGRA